MEKTRHVKKSYEYVRVFCIANFSPAYFDIEIYRSNRKSSFSYRIFQYVYESVIRSENRRSVTNSVV